jgi:hypothetical protein
MLDYSTLLLSIFFSLLISITISIDSLGLIMKSSSRGGQIASAAVGANILSYISRASVILLLPLLGLIIDEKITIFYNIILISLLVLNSIFSFLILKLYDRLSFISQQSIDQIKNGVIPFIQSYLKINKVKIHLNSLVKIKPLIALIIIYSVQFSIFPLLIALSQIYPEFKTTIVSLYGAITGCFTLYFVLIIDRRFAIKIDKLNGEAQGYCKSILLTKFYTINFILPFIYFLLYHLYYT